MPWHRFSIARKLRLLFYTCSFALGLVSTWYFNLRYMAAHHGEFAIAPFIADAFANDAAGSLSSDILVAAMVGIFWIVTEARKLGMRYAWLYVVVATLVAFAAAFPLFLFVRELRLAELERT